MLASRVFEVADEQPFVEGDRFRTYVLQAGHQFALEHMQAPPSLDDVCRATRMKRRTLQKYFQEIYGMGPTQYFRTRRLNAVRAELMEPSGTKSPVSVVSERWGFTHMGRFAMYYRRMFGETPRQTAQRHARHAVAG